MEIKTEYDDLKVQILEEFTSKSPDVKIYVVSARGNKKSSKSLETILDLMKNHVEVLPLSKSKGE